MTLLFHNRSLIHPLSPLSLQSEMMSDLATRNETEYNTFWKNFGKYLKVGIIEDEKAREDLVPLCRYFSSASSEGNLTSLPEYVKRMPEDQKFIYYVVGETRGTT